MLDSPFPAFTVDDKFQSHFKRLHQVFMYITDRCNLECEQCIYKPSINHFINEEIPLEVANNLLKEFQKLGATKVTFLGGEPTLYGRHDGGEPLLQLINSTKTMGYDYVRLDTNGKITSKFLPENRFQKLDEIAYSLDGYNAKSNDSLRGRGTFARVTESIKEALALDYKVTITCCMQKLFFKRNDRGILNLEKMIRFAEDLGIDQINFHDLFKVGIPMDTWTGNFAPEVDEWPDIYNEISQKVRDGLFSIKVRLPQCFVTKQEFKSNPEFYGYCPVKMGERVMVHPNGVIRICSNLICTGFGVARYTEEKIEWDNTHNNELAGHDLKKYTPCTNRSRHKKYGNLVPLCFSFKPGQEEHVWNNQIEWDSRSTEGKHN